ncbi:MAG: deoxyribonuclease IV [Leptolyngbya sp. PLA1]|nr:deoxyribonuclease IV [Leptolyngbya sp. PLA1]
MFGSHLSIAGSMTNALDEAVELGFDTVQVFTKNQQQWKAPPLDPGAVREWRARVAELGWQDRVVSHASYLINLASLNGELWGKSVDLMTEEIERCETLGIAFLVHHPGSHVGTTLEAGLANIARAYKEVFRRTRGAAVVSCFEGTAGAGSTIGGPFEHLRDVRALSAEATGEPERLGYCLDSCHLHAAGHDMSTSESARKVLEVFDSMCGMQHLKVWHLNDSKGKLGSRLDRHTHIGEGEVGGGLKGKCSPKRLRASGFAAIVRDPRFASVPKILETPKEDDAGGKPMDLTNLKRLRTLMK